MPPTRHLYWEDPYRTEFEAQVIDHLEVEGRPVVVLDATCFYPTSGGQPHDTGCLDHAKVLDVQEIGDRIAHVVSEPLPKGKVMGRIDWDRRFDHMQQHTGQHILSQAFERLLAADTVSFHLGADASTIDVSIRDVDEPDVQRAEKLANQIVFGNWPVTSVECSEDELASMSLRRPPKAQDLVRVVRVGDFDVCACGGTHVRGTGEVGPIHVRNWSRQRGGTRIEFLCGWRALRDYQLRDTMCQRLANELSIGVTELPEGLARIIEAERTARRVSEGLRSRLLENELPLLARGAETIGGLRVVSRVLEDFDAGNMRYFAQRLTEGSNTIALLAVRDPSPQVCFARSEDVPVDIGTLLRESMAPYGGRGGGRGHIAQGGGVSEDTLASVLDEAIKTLGER